MCGVLLPEGYRYYVHFLDDFSQFVWIYPQIKLKSNVVDAFGHFITMVKNQLRRQLKLYKLTMEEKYVKIHKMCNDLGVQ